MFKQVFLSNLDPWIGCSMLSFMFSFSIRNRPLWIAQAVLSSVTFVFSFFVLTIYQLCYSYAIYSAIITATFAYVFSEDLDCFYRKWHDNHEEAKPAPALATNAGSESATCLTASSLEQAQLNSPQADVSIDSKQSDNLC